MEHIVTSEDSKCDVVYQLLCMACLCGGRTTKTLTDPQLIKYYADILSVVQAALPDGLPSPRLCWECEALLRRVFHFTKQVQECYVTLQPTLLALGAEDLSACLSAEVSRVPHLQTYVVSTVDIPTEELASGDNKGCSPSDLLVKEEYDVHEEPALAAIKEESEVYDNEDQITSNKHGCLDYTDEPALEESLERRAYIFQDTETMASTNPETTVSDTVASKSKSTDKETVFTNLETTDRQTVAIKLESTDTVATKLESPSQKVGKRKTTLPSQPGNKYSVCQNGTRYVAILSNSQGQRKHLSTNTGEEICECSVCLRIHMGTHIGENPLKCSVCHRGFNRSYLNSDMQAHSEDKTYNYCSFCQYISKEDTNTHTKEDPYETSLPHFNTKCNLKVYMRSNTREKPHKCSVCQRGFSTGSDLEVHMIIHTGDIPEEPCVAGTHEVNNKEDKRDKLRCEGALRRDFSPSTLFGISADQSACMSAEVSRVPRLQTYVVSTVDIPTEELAPGDNKGCSPSDLLVKEEYDVHEEPALAAIKEESEVYDNEDQITSNKHGRLDNTDKPALEESLKRRTYIFRDTAIMATTKPDTNDTDKVTSKSKSTDTETVTKNLETTDQETVAIKLESTDTVATNLESPAQKVGERKTTLPCPPGNKYRQGQHRQHLSTNTRKRPYKCSVCQKGFSYTCHLRMHMGSHTEKKPYKCSVCQRGFRYSTHLKVHNGTHTEKKSYKCSVCQKGFSYINHLKMHMGSHTENKLYKCSVCQRDFSYSSHLKLHMVTHTEKKPYKCSVCQRGFGYSNHLKVHMRSHTENKPYKCSVCQRGFRYSTHMKVHMGTHTEEKPYKCSVCQREFSYSGHLKVHMGTHTEKQRYKCSICQRGFSYTSHLKVHMGTHTEEKPYKCSVCQKGFSYTSHLKMHMVRHTENKPYKCSVCQIHFSHTSHLKIHMTTHTVKPFKCSVCQRGFSHTSHLKIHMETHTEKPYYKCSVCQIVFNFSTHLKNHMQAQSEDKIYKCSVCQLKEDAKTHPKEDAYAPSVPNIDTRCNLKVYKRTNTREKPHKCTVCQSGFSTGSDLEVHMVIHNGDISEEQVNNNEPRRDKQRRELSE